MNKKSIFAISVVCVCIIIGVAFASYFFIGRQGNGLLPESTNQDHDASTSNINDPDAYNQDSYNQEAYPPDTYNQAQSNTDQYPDQYPNASSPQETNDSQENDSNYQNEYQNNTQSHWYTQGDQENPWHPIHFQNPGTPLPLDQDTPHGYLSVQHIRHLNDNYYSRFPFSYQEKDAAKWIIRQLRAMGHTWDNIKVQEFGLYDVGHTSQSIERWHTFRAVYHNHNYIRNTYTSQNIILTIPGQSDQVIIVGAHYDTVLYPGASDNASGTALLLESAQRMLEMDNYYTIIYIFFGAEEVGLLGAVYYVDNLSQEELDQILFMVNADVLFEGPYFIFGGGYYVPGNWGYAQLNALTQQWEAIADHVNASESLDLHSFPPGIFLPSDQQIFMRAGLTVMMLYGTGNPDGPAYFRVLHSYRDCYHYINEQWPYKISDAMLHFSTFLEAVLLARY